MQHTQPPAPGRQRHALALLLRQRDLQPLLERRDINALRGVCRETQQALRPRFTRSKARQHADLLAAQMEPEVRRQGRVGSLLLTSRVIECGVGPFDVRPFAHCRDLIWQAREAQRGGVHHETQVLDAQQRRYALATLYVGQWGGTVAEALPRIDTLRRLDPAAMLSLLAGDALAVSNAASSLTFGYGTLKLARRTAPEVARYWGFGGYIGPVGAAVFGVTTGALVTFAGGAALFAVDLLASRVRERKPEVAAVPYSVDVDYTLCLAILDGPVPATP